MKLMQNRISRRLFGDSSGFMLESCIYEVYLTNVFKRVLRVRNRCKLNQDDDLRYSIYIAHFFFSYESSDSIDMYNSKINIIFNNHSFYVVSKMEYFIFDVANIFEYSAIVSWHYST